MSYRFARLGLAGAVVSSLILASSCRHNHKDDAYASASAQPQDVVIEQPKTVMGSQYKEELPKAPNVPPPVTQVKPPPPETKPVTPPPETKPVVPPRPPETKPVTPPPVATETLERKPIRIRAGSITAWTDKEGNTWLADSGFTEGAMVDRGQLAIAGTNIPELYSTERCCMDKFTWPVAKGKYTVKLHFAETFDEVKKPGDRLFSFDINGQKVKDFDIFKEAGGPNKALVKTFHVDAKNGKIEIEFTKNEKEPELNGIEILPE